MKRFLLDLLRSAALYELITFGGLTLFLIGAPLFGYMPYSDMPGAGWGGGVPALDWSEYPRHMLRSMRYGTFFAMLALPVGVTCALVIVTAHRLITRRAVVRLIGAAVCAAATYFIFPGWNWYIPIGSAAIWTAVALGGLSGLVAVPRTNRKPPPAADPDTRE